MSCLGHELGSNQHFPDPMSLRNFINCEGESAMNANSETTIALVSPSEQVDTCISLCVEKERAFAQIAAPKPEDEGGSTEWIEDTFSVSTGVKHLDAQVITFLVQLRSGFSSTYYRDDDIEPLGVGAFVNRDGLASVGTKAANSLAALTLIPTTDSSVTGCVLTEERTKVIRYAFIILSYLTALSPVYGPLALG
ncbi:homeodomain-like superfamily protein [Striga asiatica]|uniref:Homeodomain-like superfamily protein n=1 Tax=Striga asiatica TaxID=4170 RepID=A0A5A7QS45_STRAF|nr:homeodomain-like superfamily protein [Striga asiatica]